MGFQQSLPQDCDDTLVEDLVGAQFGYEGLPCPRLLLAELALLVVES